MPAKLSFTSARLLSFSRKQTGGEAKFAASWNQKVAESMNWTEVPECMTGATLEGELNATSCDLVPSEGELKKHAITLDIKRVNSFQTVRLELEGKKGKGHRTELRFVVAFADTKGARKLEEYIQTLGDGKGTLTVSYTKQETLPLASEEQRQATMAEND